jgi:septal ring factor EnvC (AmiA/AmiB activator)
VRTVGLIIIIWFTLPLAAQSKKSLQEKKAKLQKELNYTAKLLKETQTDKKNSLSHLEKLNRSIEARMELIQTIEYEIKLLEQEIVSNRLEIEKKNKILQKLKDQYAEMVFTAWMNRNQFNQVMYVISAKDYNQGLRRIQYFNQVNDLRKQRLDEIIELNTRLQQKVEELRAIRENKAIALRQYTQEAQKLEQDKKQKEETLAKLKTKEKELTEKIRKKEKEKEELEMKIKAMIEKEMKEAEARKKKVKETTTTKTETKSGGIKTTGKTEAKEVKATPSGSYSESGFASNKGRLPWPVEKGVITGKFGVQPHPVFSSIEIKNDGIDITTERGASVRAVYKGEVTGVFRVDGYENVVIIRHGEYLTVYGHLASVSVSRGNIVQAKQKIGTVATDDEGRSYLNFQVRYGSSVQNPASWLSQ